MYIDSFLSSLTILEQTYSIFEVSFLKDKINYHIGFQEPFLQNTVCSTQQKYCFFYTNQKNTHQFFSIDIENILRYLQQLHQYKIAIPAASAIYLEAAIIEAVRLYDEITCYPCDKFPFDPSVMASFPTLYVLFQSWQDSEILSSMTYFALFQDFFISKFYYFIIQYCYFRFQCEKAVSLTHPHHFQRLVYNKIQQYHKQNKTYTISDLTYIENKEFDDFLLTINQ